MVKTAIFEVIIQTLPRHQFGGLHVLFYEKEAAEGVLMQNSHEFAILPSWNTKPKCISKLHSEQKWKQTQGVAK